ncbi:MAG: hypothetical protein HY848_13715 [Betaproteobacteria bacterium]|nr:hypothetical protein [Betaproteobacteria bacterium]
MSLEFNAIINNRGFGTEALFIRTKTTVGARSAQWLPADIAGRKRIIRAAALELARTAPRPRGSLIAHGRETVRTQSAILDKIYRKPLLLLSGTVFSGRMRFLSVQKRRLARASAQWPLPARDGIYGTVNSGINPL